MSEIMRINFFNRIIRSVFTKLLVQDINCACISNVIKKTNFKFKAHALYYPKDQKLQNQIRKIMWEKAGIVRSKKGLKEAVSELDAVKEPDDFETKNMLLVSKLITSSALKRPKPLGCHYLEQP